jgi:hypothetical protein
LLLLAGCDSLIGLNHVPGLDAPDAPLGYEATVLADHPIAYWRLGEATGVVAADLMLGAIDEVAIYDRALSAEAIFNHFAAAH